MCFLTQDLRLHLTGAYNGGGRINADRSAMSIIVRPRSNPCGMVSFASSVYTVTEPVNQLTQYVPLIRTYVVLFDLSFNATN